MTYLSDVTPEKNDDDSDAIVGEIVMGRSVRQIAKSRGLSIAAVHRILDLEAAAMFSGEGTRRAVAAEAARLRHLAQKLWHTAMSDADNALHAAALYVKASERLSSLLGWNHPQGHVISVINGAPEVQDSISSTQRTLDAIRLLRAGFDNASSEEDDDPSKIN